MATIAMVYQTLCRWLSGKQESIIGELHDADRFRAILECERMRADRSGIHFSLAVFSLPSSSEFLRHLRARIRATDHLGRLESNKIGVALWNTDREGAWRFVEQILTSWNGPAAPESRVYVYPSDPTDAGLNGGRDSSGRGSNETKLEPVSAMATVSQTEPLATIFVRPLTVWKRSIDVVGSLIGLIALSPLLGVAALLVRRSSPGPVFFRQERVGLGGRRFAFYKFRTMYVGAAAQRDALQQHSEQDGPAFKMKNDPRVTPIGRFLRKSCIDELPQLWNVLIGDMSLVGPRPLEPKETEKISTWGQRRLEITPGLTCIWQVYGKSRVNFAEWMRMDIRYLRSRTLLQDAWLILSTLAAVVFYRVAH